MVAAGVSWVQPGFESFSDHVLRLMRKGSTALQNVATLKWLFEFGIRISYNILVGFPGETEDDFDDLIRVISKLAHLPPPGPEAHVVQVQRFAPFHFAARELGIGAIRAAEFYERLIPPEVCAPDEYAYFFERQIPPEAAVVKYLDRLNTKLAQWCSCRRRMSLALREGNIELIMTDGLKNSVVPLGMIESAVLVLADQPTSFSSVAARLKAIGRVEETQRIVNSLAEQGLLLSQGPSLLTIVPFSVPVGTRKLGEWLEGSLGVQSEARGKPFQVITM